MKKTKIEHHKTHDKKDDRLVAQTDEVKEVTFIKGFWLTCENMENPQNRFEEKLKEIPPKNYLIDYLRKAITVEWAQNVIVKFTYRKLT